jgi:hypothetical protein
LQEGGATEKRDDGGEMIFFHQLIISMVAGHCQQLSN